MSLNFRNIHVYFSQHQKYSCHFFMSTEKIFILLVNVAKHTFKKHKLTKQYFSQSQIRSLNQKRLFR